MLTLVALKLFHGSKYLYCKILICINIFFDFFSTWEEGKMIIIDDSIEHEVWHNGTTFRMILIVDFWHPDLTKSQRDSLTPI